MDHSYAPRNRWEKRFVAYFLVPYEIDSEDLFDLYFSTRDKIDNIGPRKTELAKYISHLRGVTDE